MSLLTDAISRLLGNESKLNQIVNGDSLTTVQTDNGPVPSIAKLLHDEKAAIDAFIPAVNRKQDADQKDKENGFAGLGDNFKLRLMNGAGQVASYFISLATVERNWTLQNKDGTLAFTEDIPDVSKDALLEILQIDSIANPATLESLGAQSNLGFPPLDARLADEPLGFPVLNEEALLDPKYFPPEIEAVGIYATAADFPEAGVTKKIFIDQTAKLGYFWDGAAYDTIGASMGNTDTIVEGDVNKFFSTDRVLEVTLYGFNLIATGILTGAETIVVAFGKVQNQINDLKTTFANYAHLANGAVFTGEIQVPTVDTSTDTLDAVNVTVMRSVQAALVNALNQGVASREPAINKVTNFSVMDDNFFPTTKAVATYMDGRFVGVLKARGNWDATTNTFPSSGGSGVAGAIMTSDLWFFAGAGTMPGSQPVTNGDTIRALVDNPGQDPLKWAILDANINYIPAMNDGGNAIGTWNINTTGTVKIQDAAGANVAYALVLAPAYSGQVALKSDAEVTYNPSTNTLTVQNIVATTLNVTGTSTFGDVATFTKQPTISQAILTTANGPGVATTGWVKSLFNIANGILQLDANTLVPSIYLPSYVDDVIECDTYALLPGIGERGKIYVVLSDVNNGGKTWQYRWTGSIYTQIVNSPGTTDAIPEGVGNLYFSVARVLATVLNGFVTTNNAAIVAADTAIVAFGKAQAQLNAHLALINAIPYDIAGGFAGKPAASDVSMILVAIRKFTIPLDLSLAKGIANAAATGSYVVSLTKNGVQFATVTWAAAGTVPTFANTSGAAVVVNAGDVIRAIAPASADTTISDLSFTLPATLG